MSLLCLQITHTPKYKMALMMSKTPPLPTDVFGKILPEEPKHFQIVPAGKLQPEAIGS